MKYQILYISIEFFIRCHIEYCNQTTLSIVFATG